MSLFDQLQTPSARVLYVVQKLYDENAITIYEKGNIKDLIIENPASILQNIESLDKKSIKNAIFKLLERSVHDGDQSDGSSTSLSLRNKKKRPKIIIERSNFKIRSTVL